MDHQPVVAIVGQQARMALGGSYQQEVDLLSLFKDVASDYVQMVVTPEQLPDVVDRAIRIAQVERTVTCLIFPNDIQSEAAIKLDDLPRTHGVVYGSVGYSPPMVMPAQEDLQRAAEILNSGKKVAILIGSGARPAADLVIQVAELLGAGVAKALLGKDVLPDELPFVTGSIGLLGTKPSDKMMQECDTLLMIGSSFPYSEFLPAPGQARGVQIDIDGKMIGIRYPMEVNLVGDSKATLQALIPMLQRKSDRSWREKIEKNVSDWWEVVEAQSMNEANPVNPQRVFWELSPFLPDNCILAADSGSVANWYARNLKIRRGMRASLSGNLATMGCGVPYAIAAKFAYPDRTPVALVGDGAMLMNGINGLVTIAHYWKQWPDPRLVILVLHNNDLNQVTWEMRVMEGDPKFEASQDVPDFPYAQYAEMLGLKGIRVDRPEQIEPAWREAFAAGRPVVIDAITDPDVPPLPPHITFEQAKAYASALLKGDPDEAGIIKQTIKGMADTVLPRR